jgi:predicted RNase H-like HicB family nuclease
MERSYPAVIGKDEGGTVFGVVFPDLPGCVSVGDTPEEAIKMGTEALSGHIALMIADGDPLPEPTPLDQVELGPDEEGFMVVSIPVVDATVWARR